VAERDSPHGVGATLVIELAYNPARAFDRLKQTDVLRLAVVLLAVRSSVTAATTVTSMYVNRSPMFLKPPFGIGERVYRYYELFWYAPYTVLTVLAIALVLFYVGRRLSDAPDFSFQKTFEIVSLSFFTPWLLTVPGDCLLVVTVNARPQFLVPFHVLILIWECCLIALGFRRIFGMAASRCAVLALIAASLFIVMAGLLVR
jgi:hypothetical protein